MLYRERCCRISLEHYCWITLLSWQVTWRITPSLYALDLQDRICPGVIRVCCVPIGLCWMLLFHNFSRLCWSDLGASEMLCGLCFAYFSTLSLEIVAHVDNLLLQTLLDFFLTCIIFLAGAWLSSSFVFINFKLSNRKTITVIPLLLKKTSHFLLLDYFLFFPIFGNLARACIPLIIFTLIVVLFLFILFIVSKKHFLYLLLKNFNLFIFVFRHPKFSFISIDFPHFSFCGLRDLLWFIVRLVV